MYTNNISVNQINNVFNSLTNINNLKYNRYSLATSENSVEVRNSENLSTVQKVTRFVSDWWWGKSEQISSLTHLTGRISKLVNGQKVNVDQLHLEKIHGAVKGLEKFSNQYGDNTREKLSLQRAIKDLVYVSDEVKKTRYLKSLFPGQMSENLNSMKKAVKKLVVNETLTQKTTLKEDTVTGHVTVPAQFSVDCDRFNQIALNGQVLYKQPLNPLNRVQSVIEQVKRFIHPTPSVAKIGQTMNQSLGTKTFDRVGALQTQSFISDRVVKLVNEKSTAEVFEKLPGFHITQAGGYDYHIKSGNNRVEVDGKLVLEVNYLDPHSQQDNPLKTMGYIGVRRIVSTPKNELEMNLEEQSINKRLPGLKVRDVISPISWNVDDALTAINAF
jgi:hypothetical protein